jgi:hypothetical protein
MEVENIHVSSFTELINYAIGCIDQDTEIGSIDFTDNFNFTIKIEGRNWDGLIDYRIANYIIDLQDSVKKLFKEASDIQSEEFLNYVQRNLIVKARVTEGCSEIFIEKFDKILTAFFKNMTGAQKTIAFTVAAAALATSFCYSDYNETKFKTQEAQSHQEIVGQLIEHSDKLADVIERNEDLFLDMEKPVRNLVNKLDEKDIISLPVSQNKLTITEAKALYPRRPRLTVKTAYIDGSYDVLQIKTDKTGNVIFFLEKDGTPVKATLNINDDEFTPLYNKIMTAHQNSQIPTVNIQLTAKYTSKKITSATIVGVGAARETATTLLALWD